ncbi:MAG: hypothetical protein V4471_06855 [Pseudomonadota bacterium]
MLTVIARLISLFFLMLLSISNSYASGMVSHCHPLPNSNKAQYIIAYGSLMETKSKNGTDSTSGENRPVSVTNYQRGWFSRGEAIGLSTTYLGVIKNLDAHFNGTVFPVATPASLKNYDKREKYYCRVSVPKETIHTLDCSNLAEAEFWIYVIKPEFMAKPSKKYPIVESYVDIFLSGCIEIENKFHLKNFATDCVSTTRNWSTHWVNDRIYPRRPFVFEPNALEIDNLLNNKIPEIFHQIKIE